MAQELELEEVKPKQPAKKLEEFSGYDTPILVDPDFKWSDILMQAHEEYMQGMIGQCYREYEIRGKTKMPLYCGVGYVGHYIKRGGERIYPATKMPETYKHTCAVRDGKVFEFDYVGNMVIHFNDTHHYSFHELADLTKGLGF